MNDIATIPFPEVGDGVALAVWFLLGVGFPFLVDLITDRLASPRVKASAFLVLQLLNGVLSGFLIDRGNGKTFDWNSALWATLITFVIGQSVFKWGKNADILGKKGVVAGALPNGFGKAVQPEVGEVQYTDGTRSTGVIHDRAIVTRVEDGPQPEDRLT